MTEEPEAEAEAAAAEAEEEEAAASTEAVVDDDDGWLLVVVVLLLADPCSSAQRMISAILASLSRLSRSSSIRIHSPECAARHILSAGPGGGGLLFRADLADLSFLARRTRSGGAGSQVSRDRRASRRTGRASTRSRRARRRTGRLSRSRSASRRARNVLGGRQTTPGRTTMGLRD